MSLEPQYLADIIDFLPDATFVVNREGRVIAWNKAIETMTGIGDTEMLGKGNREYALPFYGERVPLLIDLALSPQELINTRYDFVERDNETLITEIFIPSFQKDGAYLWAKASPLYDKKGDIIGAIETIRDITRRKKAEQALLDQLYFLQVLIDAIPSPIFYKDPQGRYLGCNAAFEQCLGFAKERLIGKTVHDIFHPDLAEIYQRADLDLFSNPGVQSYEGPAIYSDGTENEVIFNKATFFNADGSMGGLVGTVWNITRRKNIEKALRDSEAKLRFLSAKLLNAHEQERRRLAAELHDELGQTLNVLKMQIRYIEKRLGKNQQDLRVDCEYLLDYMDAIIDSVRRISRDLSPSILQDLGLTCALEHLIDEFTKNYKITCTAQIDNIDRLFARDSQIILFRILQESLTNIAKHAEANQVNLKIEKRANTVFFSIADNGKGFDLGKVMELNSAQKGLGLAAMDERVRMLGGTLDLCSREGLGTRISFSLKVN